MRDGMPEIKMKQVEPNNRIVIVIQRLIVKTRFLAETLGSTACTAGAPVCFHNVPTR